MKSLSVSINPELIRWARERAGRSQESLLNKFKKLPEWETGDEAQLTLKQVEDFARAVHVPVGYLFLSTPPEEPLPIEDFRTHAGQEVMRPSPNLLDTIYICQERQDWYRDFARETQQPELRFVDSVTTKTPAKTAAAQMRETLGFDLAARRECRDQDSILRLLRDQAEEAGVLVMISGVVQNNTKRPLDPKEFCGFALSDPLAPLVFINGKDAKAAQIFTLAHELAHLWLGDSVLSIIEVKQRRHEEKWCDEVAAEFLVPLAELRGELRDDEPLAETLPRLAKSFNVSILVILWRLFDAERLDRQAFQGAWADEIERLREIERLHEIERIQKKKKSSGGNYYLTTLNRVSRRFARALMMSTLEGRTLYRDASRMLGVSKTKTFDELGRKVGVIR